ncbi:MAG: hypothetical protein GKR99_12030 [Rhodobacteraceae bacterium]|nr:hypothetical protein [Paracoccaceae bacterium]
MGLKRTEEFRQDSVRIALTSGLGSGPINPTPLAPNPRNISGLGRAGKCGSLLKRPEPLR